MMKLLFKLISFIPGLSAVNPTIILASLAVIIISTLGFCTVKSCEHRADLKRLKEGVQNQKAKAFNKNKQETEDFVEYQKNQLEKNRQIEKDNPDLDAFKDRVKDRINKNIDNATEKLKKDMDKNFDKVKRVFD